MSNTHLIARLRARRAHGIVGGTQLVVSTNPDALCTEAADALEQQDAIIAGLRSDDAALTGENAEQAALIEALVKWKAEGELIFEKKRGFMPAFYIGSWWADRPWREK